MKRREVVRRIAQAAANRELSWFLLRQGSGHEIFTLDGLRIPIPRHRDLNEITALGIFKQCEPKLGTRWWTP